MKVKRQVERREEGWVNLPRNLELRVNHIRERFELAGGAGHAGALNNLGTLYFNGRGKTPGGEPHFDEWRTTRRRKRRTKREKDTGQDTSSTHPG